MIVNTIAQEIIDIIKRIGGNIPRNRVSCSIPGYGSELIAITWHLQDRDYTPHVHLFTDKIELTVPEPCLIAKVTLAYDDPDFFRKTENWLQLVLKDQGAYTRWYNPLDLGIIYQINALCVANAGLLSFKHEPSVEDVCGIIDIKDAQSVLVQLIDPRERASDSKYYISLYTPIDLTKTPIWNEINRSLISYIKATSNTFLDTVRRSLQEHAKITLKMPSIKEFIIPSAEIGKHRW